MSSDRGLDHYLVAVSSQYNLLLHCSANAISEFLFLHPSDAYAGVILATC